MPDQLVRQRIFLFQLVVLLAFGLLIAQLWRIQIMGGASYQLLSRENSVATELLDAPRGVIYDRQGQILVRNRPHFRATLQPALVLNETWAIWTDEQWAQAAATLGRMAAALQMDFPAEAVAPDALREAFEDASGQMLVEDIGHLCQDDGLLACFAEALITAPYESITVQNDLSPEVAFLVMENSVSLPGLTVVPESQREYLYGSLYAHLLGYQLPITQRQLDRQTRYTTNPYLPADRIGAAGIEAGFEDEMRGTRGLRQVEENVVGRQIRVLNEEPAQPGHNLFLTIDTDLQQEVTEALRAGLDGVGSQEGVAIVMNPNTGEVLAMVSLPTYDNNLFVGDPDPEQYAALSEDPQKPMLNRAISGIYPPGSIFKIIPALGGLADGILTRETTIFDPGRILLPDERFEDPALALEYARPFVCWLERGHGDENVVEALAHSCDVFFYEVGGGYLDEFRGLGIDALAGWAQAFGLGEPTRIRLPGEATGLVPGRQWKRLVWQQSWLKGDTYNMSIGQGYLSVTPLQILNATTAIANGGIIYEPQVVFQVQDATGNVVQPFEPRVLRRLDVDPRHLATVAEGMLGATTWEDGTAQLVFGDSPVRVAGKTGTAEYCERYEKPDGTPDCRTDEAGNQLTHAWFTAFAPYDDPEIALVVFVHGNKKDVIQGSEIAAPIARRIIDYYFSRRPLDPPPGPPPAEAPIDAEAAPTLDPQATPTGESEAAPTQPPAPTPPPPPPTATTMPKPEPTLAPPPTAPSNGQYVGALLSTDGHDSERSVVSGRVVDASGSPRGGVRITLDGGGSPVATLTTAPDGSFRYDLLDPIQASTWFVRAPDLAGSPVVSLVVAPYEHYIVLFQED